MALYKPADFTYQAVQISGSIINFFAVNHVDLKGVTQSDARTALRRVATGDDISDADGAVMMKVLVFIDHKASGSDLALVDGHIRQNHQLDTAYLEAKGNAEQFLEKKDPVTGACKENNFLFPHAYSEQPPANSVTCTYIATYALGTGFQECITSSNPTGKGKFWFIYDKTSCEEKDSSKGACVCG